GRTGLQTQPAEDTPGVVDLVRLGVALPGRVPLLLGVVGPLDVDGVGRAGPGAQLTADALLQPVRVPVEDVPAVVARRHRVRPLGVLARHRLAEHVGEGDAEPLDRVQDLAHLSYLLPHRPTWTPPERPRACRRSPPGRAGSAAPPGPAAA